MSNSKRKQKNNFLSIEELTYTANAPTGGSGSSAYISGRIQAMAEEILRLRQKLEELQANKDTQKEDEVDE